MIAQKLKNNKISISSGDQKRKDAIATIENLRMGEFFNLTHAARDWNKSLNDKRDIMFTIYENEHSKVCRVFDHIYERRNAAQPNEWSLNEEDCVIISSKKNSITHSDPIKESKDAPDVPFIWASRVKGTSRLIKFSKKKSIKIVRRKGLIDDNNKPNSVCISNDLREQFFADCKECKNFNGSGPYEIMYDEESPEIYNKWSEIIDNIYKEGIPKDVTNS